MDAQGDINRKQADDPDEGAPEKGGGEDESGTEAEGADDHLHDDQKAPSL